MNPRYAFFIWFSYGLTLAVLVWNLAAPYWRRRQLQRRLRSAEDEDDDEEVEVFGDGGDSR